MTSNQEFQEDSEETVDDYGPRLEELKNYQTYTPSKSCFLDGRYFETVLINYDEVITEPLFVNLRTDKNGSVVEQAVFMTESRPKTDVTFIRLVVNTPDLRHAALLIVDEEQETITLWNPVVDNKMEALEGAVVDLVKEYMFHYREYQMNVVNYKIPDIKTCETGGYCNAYVIKYVLGYLNDKPYNTNEILSFVSAIEENFGDLLPDGEPEVEYRFGGGHGGHGGHGGYHGGHGGYGGGGFGMGLGAGLLTGAVVGSALSPGYGYSPYYYPPSY